MLTAVKLQASGCMLFAVCWCGGLCVVGCLSILCVCGLCVVGCMLFAGSCGLCGLWAVYCLLGLAGSKRRHWPADYI